MVPRPQSSHSYLGRFRERFRLLRVHTHSSTSPVAFQNTQRSSSPRHQSTPTLKNQRPLSRLEKGKKGPSRAVPSRERERERERGFYTLERERLSGAPFCTRVCFPRVPSPFPNGAASARPRRGAAARRACSEPDDFRNLETSQSLKLLKFAHFKNSKSTSFFPQETLFSTGRKRDLKTRWRRALGCKFAKSSASRITSGVRYWSNSCRSLRETQRKLSVRTPKETREVLSMRRRTRCEANFALGARSFNDGPRCAFLF